MIPEYAMENLNATRLLAQLGSFWDQHDAHSGSRVPIGEWMGRLAV